MALLVTMAGYVTHVKIAPGSHSCGVTVSVLAAHGSPKENAQRDNLTGHRARPHHSSRFEIRNGRGEVLWWYMRLELNQQPSVMRLTPYHWATLVSTSCGPLLAPTLGFEPSKLVDNRVGRVTAARSAVELELPLQVEVGHHTP